MPTYRIFTVSHDGHLSGAPEVVECTDDVEAVKRAMQVVDGLAVEIRDNSRIVARRPGWRKHCKPVSPIPLPRHTEPLGMDEKNIEVNVVNGVLIIKAKRSRGRKRRKRRITICENVASAHFSAPFRCLMGLISTKSSAASRMGCSP